MVLVACSNSEVSQVSHKSSSVLVSAHQQQGCHNNRVLLAVCRNRIQGFRVDQAASAYHSNSHLSRFAEASEHQCNRSSRRCLAWICLAACLEQVALEVLLRRSSNAGLNSVVETLEAVVNSVAWEEDSRINNSNSKEEVPVVLAEIHSVVCSSRDHQVEKEKARSKVAIKVVASKATGKWTRVDLVRISANASNSSSTSRRQRLV
mmetsp:Transcript_28526/g.45903  ORF Transcript_28526/g.45903 Transcript_28526/m.45903 type:complete len:206 (-) Transcript_28526:2207-2824(-)